jgi:hypothetical protein
MVFFGILSLIQILFLPGMLLHVYLKIQGSFLKKLVFVIGSSFTINYLLAFLLTSLRIYQRPVILVLIILEILALIWLKRNDLLVPVRKTWESTWESITTTITGLFHTGDEKKDPSSTWSLIRPVLIVILGALAVSTIWHMVTIFIQNIPSVFNTWDAVVSWNRWATEWAANGFPTQTEDYPQLLPVNWSLTYLLIGTTSVQFFAKALMPLFLLLILLMVFDLALEEKSFGLFLSVWVAYLAVKHFVGDYITDGYADIPLAFFCFLSIYALLKAVHEDQDHKWISVVLGFLFACAAAVTKQPGFYIIVIYPILAYLLVIKDSPTISRKKILWMISMAALGVLVIVAPWYILKYIQIFQKTEMSHLLIPISRTGQAHDSSSLLVIIPEALKSLDRYLYLFLLIFPGLLVIKKPYRWIGLLIVIPYTLLWAGYASYSVRNLTLVLPFLGLVFGVAFEGIIRFVAGWLDRMKVDRIPWVVVLAIIALSTLALPLLVTNERLVSTQRELQKQIFNPNLNEKLYEYFESHPLDGIILTNYPVQYLPGFEDRQLYSRYNKIKDFNAAVNDPQVKYLLVPSGPDAEVRQALDEGTAAGIFRLEFSVKNYIPYEFYVIEQKP